MTKHTSCRLRQIEVGRNVTAVAFNMSLSEKPQSQSLLFAFKKCQLTDLVVFHPPETIWIRAFQCGSFRFFLDVFTGLEVQLPETQHLRTAMTEKSQNKLPVGPLVSLFRIRHIFFFKLFAEHHPKPFKYLVRANSMTWGVKLMYCFSYWSHFSALLLPRCSIFWLFHAFC